MNTPLALQLATFAVDLQFDDIPSKVVDKSKQLILDTLGIAIGSTQLPFGANLVSLVESWGGTKEASIVGSSKLTTAQNAAFCNGVLAHGQDYDDTHTASVVHPTAALLPAALAVAEEVGASGKNLLTALVAGTEAAIAIALPAPNRFHQRGFHTTSVATTFASALIAAKLKGLDTARTTHALGICGSLVSGLIECVPAGADAKRLHAGWPAMAGIIATQLAGIDYSGPASVFEGKLGVYNSMLRDEDIDLKGSCDHLGRDWLLLDVRPKIYPCCHYLQAFIDCAASLRQKIDGRVDKIRKIECRVPQGAVNIVCEPWEKKLNPATGYEARFSLPYSVAVMLARGQATSHEFSEAALQEHAVRELMPRIEYAVDPSREVRDMPGWVKVIMSDGNEHIADVPVVRGDRQTPFSMDDIKKKLVDNALFSLGEDGVRQLISTVDQLETQSNLKALASGFAAAVHRR